MRLRSFRLRDQGTDSSSWKAIVLSGTILLVGVAGPLSATASAAPRALTSIVSAASGGFQAGGPMVAPANCTTPVLSQPFLAWQDTGWYTIVSGQNPDEFTGAGWTLYGGASAQSATLLDGNASSVLDIPADGFAISPPACVASDYPTARTIARGSAGSMVLVGAFYTDRTGPGASGKGLQLNMSGIIPGNPQWDASAPLQVHPGIQAGWQIVRFVFFNAGPADAQLYNFYVDPRMSK